MESLVMENLFSGCYKNTVVVITGHTGFKGSWLSSWLNHLGAKVVGYSLGEVSDPSHFKLLNASVKTFYGDIRDINTLEKCFNDTNPEIVFHLAAQSLVRESYRKPVDTYSTNVLGTLNVLEASRRSGTVKAIVNVTTDKVYKNKERTIAFKENDSLGGHDIYSSSKACSEILTESYRESFLLNDEMLLATARAGNVIGGGDWAADRLIPDLMRAINSGVPAEIRSPRSIRPWEHVLEPLAGYLLLGQKLLERKKPFSGSWNFGPAKNQSVPVTTILRMMKSRWHEINYSVSETEDKRFHEANLLRLNCSKSNKYLKWRPVWNLRKTIEKTSDWYQLYYEQGRINSFHDLESYVSDAAKNRLIWTK